MTARELAIQPARSTGSRSDAALLARDAAAVAGRQAGVTVRELAEVADLGLASALFQSIWGRREAPPISTDMLRALSHGGSYVAGAFDPSGRMEGALVGFLAGGREDLHLHSHILGVLPGTQARGCGFALKLHQRAWSIARGHESIEWTFDPLVRRNAYFNLGKLGAEVGAYLVNFYGVMRDSQNGEDDSDRLLVRWNLLSDRAFAAAGGALAPPIEPAARSRAQLVLGAGAGEEPVAGAAAQGRVVLLQVPADIVALRRDAPGLATSWRRAFREAALETLRAGYTCTGVTRDGKYVFRSPEAGPAG